MAAGPDVEEHLRAVEEIEDAKRAIVKLHKQLGRRYECSYRNSEHPGGSRDMRSSYFVARSPLALTKVRQGAHFEWNFPGCRRAVKWMLVCSGSGSVSGSRSFHVWKVPPRPWSMGIVHPSSLLARRTF